MVKIQNDLFLTTCFYVKLSQPYIDIYMSEIWPEFVQHDDDKVYMDLRNFNVFDTSKMFLPIAINTNVAQKQLKLIRPHIEARITFHPILPYTVFTSPLLLLITAHPKKITVLTKEGVRWPRTTSVITLLRFYMGISYLFETSAGRPDHEEILEFHATYTNGLMKKFYEKIDNDVQLRRLADVHKSLGTLGTRPSDFHVFSKAFAAINRGVVIEFVQAFEIQIMKWLGVPHKDQALFYTSKEKPPSDQVSNMLRVQLKQQEILFLRYHDEANPDVMSLEGVEQWPLSWHGTVSHEALYNMALFCLKEDESKEVVNDEMQIDA